MRFHFNFSNNYVINKMIDFQYITTRYIKIYIIPDAYKKDSLIKKGDESLMAPSLFHSVRLEFI